MPTLNWIGKDRVAAHVKDVPFRMLSHQYGFRAGDKQNTAPTGSGNRIIHGDNLEALKALLPELEGRVDCIYIDPPYNTGQEHWVYNDNVNDPQLRKWLGEVVGPEGEDLTRHDKWLCMMYPRLLLLKQMLSEKGSLVISIGFHEVNALMMLCKELFATKQVVSVTVQTSGGKPSGGFNYLHEHLVFVIDKDIDPNALPFCGGTPRRPFEGLTLSTFNKNNRPNQTYPIFVNKETETIVGVGLSLQEQIDQGLYCGEKADFVYDYSIAPEGCVAVWPITSKGKECVWRQIPTRIMGDWKKGYIKVTRNNNENHPNKFSIQYLPSGLIKKIKNGDLDVIGHEEGKPTLILGENTTEGTTIPTIWAEKSFYTVKGTTLFKDIIPEESRKFDYPKSLELVKSVLQALTDENSIVLDSFGGSATTAHAVMSLNSEDDGDRKFVLVEMMPYAESITAERMRRVMAGYPFKGKKEEEIYSKKLTLATLPKANKWLEEARAAAEAAASQYEIVSRPKIADNCLKVIGTHVYEDMMPGLGGSFDYYELGEPLFREDGMLNEAVGEDTVRQYVYHSETRQPLTRQRSEAEPYLMDTYAHTAYYFYYEPAAPTTLDRQTLSQIVRTRAEQYIIYADRCLLEEAFMKAHNIRFKKIPRDIKKL